MTTSARTNFRWVICGLLFFAAAINYIDRQVIGILKSTLQKEFVFDERAYAAIVFSFQAAYAIGLLLAGRVIDRIGGGWLSSHFLKLGWTPNAARKTAMLICALAVVPIVFAAQTTNLWLAVAIVSIAAAAHQGWSANLFTLTSDMFPKQAVGSVVGIGGMAGAIGGMFIALIVGEILQRTGSYFLIFIIAGSAYLVALLLIHLLVPRLEPAKL